MNFNNEPRGRYQAARELGVAETDRILKMLAHGPMRTGEIVTRIERTRATVKIATRSHSINSGKPTRVKRRRAQPSALGLKSSPLIMPQSTPR